MRNLSIAAIVACALAGPAVAQDPDWKKAKDMKKDLDAQWPLVESALNSGKNPADLSTYYGDMLAQAEPKDLSTKTLRNALGVFLAGGRALPDFWLDAARGVSRVSSPVNTFLNGTIPALTNINVGSLYGTSGADCTTS